jgi:hypothetical protein
MLRRSTDRRRRPVRGALELEMRERGFVLEFATPRGLLLENRRARGIGGECHKCWPPKQQLYTKFFLSEKANRAVAGLRWRQLLHHKHEDVTSVFNRRTPHGGSLCLLDGKSCGIGSRVLHRAMATSFSRHKARRAILFLSLSRQIAKLTHRFPRGRHGCCPGEAANFESRKSWSCR